MSAVGPFYLFNGFEVAQLELSCYEVCVGSLEFLGLAGGFSEVLLEGVQERGPLSLRLWGGS